MKKFYIILGVILVSTFFLLTLVFFTPDLSMVVSCLKGPKTIMCMRKVVLKNTANFQYDLGGIYYDEYNYKKAIYSYTKSAKQGNTDAQYMLGYMCETGLGVLKSDKQAIYWYTKSANQGNAAAQNNLGLMYNNGQGVLKSYKQAIYWYTKSAKQLGDSAAYAQNNLGLMYEFGHGVLKSYKQALYWYTKSANQGNAKGEYNLGLLYVNGYGVEQNNIKAYAWWLISAYNGDESASKKLEIAKEKMSDDEIHQAKKLSYELSRKIVHELLKTSNKP